jgi:hypothetical protein
MKTNLGMLLRLPRLGVGAALLALLAFSVSSAQASIIAEWTSGTLDTPLPTGVSSATPLSFNYNTGTIESIIFTVNLTPSYTASGMTGLFSFVVSGGTGSHTVTINGATYGNGTNSNIAVTPTSGSISAGGSDSFTINFSANAHGMNVDFTDVQFDGTPLHVVPEPINYALAAFGLMFVGGSAGRFYLGRRRLATAS